jgi:hypothetical protein
MGLASYKIFGAEGDWHVEHDGKALNTYGTKEAAFESAVAAASLARRQGHEIVVTVPGVDAPGETATGSQMIG